MKKRDKSGGGSDFGNSGVRAKKNRGLDNPLVCLFAHRFRQWRIEHNKTLKQVADDLGMSIAIVSEWENCNRFPTIKTLQFVVEYTGVPAWAYFHPGNGDGMKPSRVIGKSKRTHRT